MKVLIEKQARNRKRMRDLKIGETAFRTKSIPASRGAPNALIMRAEPCDIDTEKAWRTGENIETRDVYVVNLATGRAWFADGDEYVVCAEAEVRAIMISDSCLP